MKHTITRLFDSRAQAETAVRELEAAGVPPSDISIVASHRTAGEDRSFGERDASGDGKSETAEGAGKGAATGGALGAGAGLLAGLGLLAIPGIGPVVAAGWLASTAAVAAAGAVAGGAAGGLLGALKDAGVSEDDANVYAEGVRRGGTLVSVRVDGHDTDRVQGLLDRNQSIDAAKLGAEYRQSGWTRFDENAPAYDARPPV